MRFCGTDLGVRKQYFVIILYLSPLKNMRRGETYRLNFVSHNIDFVYLFLWLPNKFCNCKNIFLKNSKWSRYHYMRVRENGETCPHCCFSVRIYPGLNVLIISYMYIECEHLQIQVMLEFAVNMRYKREL